MRDLSIEASDPRRGSSENDANDQAHEIRMAWIAALWAMLALLAAASVLWEGWGGMP